MDQIIGTTLKGDPIDAALIGEPVLVPGKKGQSLSFNGQGQWADLGDHRNRCIHNLENCPQG